MDKFIARYEAQGLKKSIAFDKAIFNEEKAKEYLASKGIQNFFFFWEPYEATEIDNNTFLFRGDVGFDITTEKLMPYLKAGNTIVFDCFGGDLWEGLKMYDFIKGMDTNPSIGVLGSCASAITLPLMATTNSWMTPNSRFLVHNPWTWEAGDDTQLRQTADELEKEKLNIANIYSDVTGRTTEEELQLMSEERFLTAQETLGFNYINHIKTNFNLKDDNMKNEDVQKELSSLGKMVNSISENIKALLPKSSPKNIIIQDVNGVEIDFGEEIETADQVAVGTSATIDGAPAEGSNTVENIGVITFEAGVVTEIVPEETGGDEEMEALKAENADLKEQLANVQNSLMTMTAERDEHKNSLMTVEKDLTLFKAELNSFKTKFSDDNPKPNTPPSNTEGKKKFTYKNNLSWQKE